MTGGATRFPAPGRCPVGVAIIAAMLLVLAGSAGCTRTEYRRRADRDVYGIERERLGDTRWRVPERPVEPDPRSRMDFRFDPDLEPIPPDDPAARLFQVSRGRSHEFHGWAKRGTAPIESDEWVAHLPRAQDGSALISRETVLPLALMHSREYQSQVETLYLAALQVSLARFEFMAQPLSRTGLGFVQTGIAPNQSRTLTLDSQNGASLNLLSGGQLIATLSNALVWEFAGEGTNAANSSLLMSFTQPLLRNATIRIRTQALSAVERGMLYQIRDFAQFRRTFYVQFMAQAYLSQLASLQGIRNQREQLDSLRRSLDQSESQVRAGIDAPTQRDQVAANYQRAQVLFVEQEAGLQSSLDGFKVSLGLPPELPITLDETPLRTFELIDPRLEALRDRMDDLFLEVLAPAQSPTPEELDALAARLEAGRAELVERLVDVRGELRKLRGKEGLPPIDDDLPQALPDASQARSEGAEAVIERLGPTLYEVSQRLDELATDVARYRRLLGSLRGGPEPTDPAERETLALYRSEETAAWFDLRTLLGKRFLSRVSDVYIAQNQVRVFLIELRPVDVATDQAITIALQNRPDLMNARAQVTDAWRSVEIAANQLQGGLELQVSHALGTDPLHDGLFRFDASQGTTRVGLGFDAPVNRYAERNAYRAAQLQYQQARRSYMAARDSIVQEIRADVRSLLLNSRQFDIAREQLITQSRQVEQVEFNLRNSFEADPTATIQLLDAINGLLGARNTLISNWVSYETARMGLFRDLGIMDIDAQGVWTNESVDLATLAPRPERTGDEDEFARELAPDVFKIERPRN